ncbi:uncharacterized protein LOC129914954 [Episyrphus balteatus]|uniref:uncharacterized protein LOC129914954 n=1 Tax=Episyrphus balteatus TaxID=286459 RepID=UPI002484F240|nr:uncharacterized protein LOC129914954 [Episyrphus balteatus]
MVLQKTFGVFGHLVILGTLLQLCRAASEDISGSVPAAGATYQNAGMRTVLRVYDECSKSEGGFVPCLKKKTVSFIDRISIIDAITVADGIKVVRLPDAPIPRPVSENELESILPRSIDDRDTKLTTMLIDRLSRFFNGHSMQVNFPKLTSEEIGRGLEEGRGKMKKMMGMMMMGMAMKMMGMIPLAMGALYILAGKALIISKIALLLAGIIGLKKLMSGRGGNGGGGGGSSGWSSGGGGGGGGWSSGGGGSAGWDRRSLNEAQELAYRGYSKAQQQAQQQQQQQLLQQPSQMQQEVQKS